MDGLRAMALGTIVALAAGGAASGAAHAAPDDGGSPIPPWVKTLFGYYVDGYIGDAELVGALQYLVDLGVITLPAGATAPAVSPEAKTAMALAELIDGDVDGVGFWLAAMRLALAMGDYPQDGRAEFNRALAATERTMEASAAWSDTIKAAAGDGVITPAERTAMAAAEGAAATAAKSERAAYDREFAPWVEHLISPYGGAVAALQNALAAAGGDDDDG